MFWDTNIFIYLIEQHPTFHSKVLEHYRTCQRQGDPLVTSALTLGELLAQPLRHGRVDLVRKYSDLLSRGEAVELVPFDRSAAEYYADIRAKTSLRQPDALQLACATAGGARVFMTNDERLWGISIPQVEDIRGL